MHEALGLIQALQKPGVVVYYYNPSKVEPGPGGSEAQAPRVPGQPGILETLCPKKTSADRDGGT